MTTRFKTKTAARAHAWDQLKHEKLARFPFPPHGRIPNFKGAEVAAQRLFEAEPWASAKAIKVNPDSPQAHVRRAALARGVTIYVPTPRLTGGFWKLDPADIPPDKFREASQMKSMGGWARAVELADMPQLDAIVTGCAAVTPAGKRCGKGAGYSDIEFSILIELGHRPVPVATTVHDVQVVDDFPVEENDLPLTLIATPTRTLTVTDPLPPPTRIQWERLSEDDLVAMPILAELKQLKQRG
jgi:5-formyltetrahydrofolate cyclo-ligase